MNITETYRVNINPVRISLWFVALLVIVAISFLFIFSNDEGHEVNPVLLNICNCVFLVIVNPFVYFFSQMAFFKDWWQLIAGAITGCLFYGLLIEMLTMLYKRFKFKRLRVNR
jgi:hypothetical protein